MATKQYFAPGEIRKGSPFMSAARTTIETAFYGNNVYPVETVKEAYKMAAESPGTIVTDMPVYKPELIGMPSDAKVLVFNDGSVYGRAAAARRILGWAGVDEDEYCTIIREAIYNTRNRTMFHAQSYIGLDKEFMVKAHLLLPEGEENVMLSWLLNFQYLTEEYNKMYADSREIPGESDLYIFSDPQWSHPDYPMGLTFFDPKHNCAALLGMRYFGEHKKGTLTLAWGVAARQGYASCHGGQKRYDLADGKKFVMGVFGLSGSGKSTITHAQHDGKYNITVLHDDAFVISTTDSSSIALEPAYFDKTQDYPPGDPNNDYLLTVQNNGVTTDENGKVVLVTEDIRNGNGRAMKSRLWSPNRIDRLDEPANAIVWLMKDSTLPPVVKVDDPVLAATMGATLATVRTSAERLPPGVDPNALVIEPYANPFRTYPLAEDYDCFKTLFTKNKIDCYIVNTGSFGTKKITKEVTLGALEQIVENKASFKPFGNVQGMSYMPVEGYNPDFADAQYKASLADRMHDRVEFVEKKAVEKNGYDKLPDETLNVLRTTEEAIRK